MYTRALAHFKTALKHYEWENPANKLMVTKDGEVTLGGIRMLGMLPRARMEDAMEHVMCFPPKKTIYEFDPLFVETLHVVEEALWKQWKSVQDAAAKIQSVYRGSRERRRYVAMYTTALAAVRMLQRNVRSWMFNKRLQNSGKWRKNFGDKDDPSTLIRLRLTHIEQKLDKVIKNDALAATKSRQDMQLLIGLVASVHETVRSNRGCGGGALPTRGSDPRQLGYLSQGPPTTHRRRGFKGY